MAYKKHDWWDVYDVEQLVEDGTASMYRNINGFTVRSAAQKLGVPESTGRAWESGERRLVGDAAAGYVALLDPAWKLAELQVEALRAAIACFDEMPVEKRSAFSSDTKHAVALLRAGLRCAEELVEKLAV